MIKLQITWVFKEMDVQSIEKDNADGEHSIVKQRANNGTIEVLRGYVRCLIKVI